MYLPCLLLLVYSCFRAQPTTPAPKSDATTGARQHHSSSHGRDSGRSNRSRQKRSSKQPTNNSSDGRSRNSISSTSSLSDDNKSRRNTAASSRNKSNIDTATRGNDENDSSSSRSPHRRRAKKKDSKRHQQQQQRRQMDRAIDAALSSSSGSSSSDDDPNVGGKAKKRPSRLKPQSASEASKPQERDRHQAGDTVEARFGGRSKWFPGKVRRFRMKVQSRRGVLKSQTGLHRPGRIIAIGTHAFLSFRRIRGSALLYLQSCLLPQRGYSHLREVRSASTLRHGKRWIT